MFYTSSVYLLVYHLQYFSLGVSLFVLMGMLSLQAANFCADRLHHALAEEVESCFVQGQNLDQNAGDWEAKWLTVMTQCFKRMDAEVGGFCLEEGECPASDNPRCCPEPIAPETVGTTAIVAVVGACQIIVGNCGDSRAVLSRGGAAIPLSVDHKVCFCTGFFL